MHVVPSSVLSFSLSGTRSCWFYFFHSSWIHPLPTTSSFSSSLHFLPDDSKSFLIVFLSPVWFPLIILSIPRCVAFLICKPDYIGIHLLSVSLCRLDGDISTFWSFPSWETCSGGLSQPCFESYAPVSTLLKCSVSQIILAWVSRASALSLSLSLSRPPPPLFLSPLAHLVFIFLLCGNCRGQGDEKKHGGKKRKALKNLQPNSLMLFPFQFESHVLFSHIFYSTPCMWFLSNSECSFCGLQVSCIKSLPELQMKVSRI